VTVSLLHGAVPWMLSGLGLLGLGALLVAPGRRWWLRALPLAVGSALLLTLVAVGMVDWWWRPFPDALPLDVVLLLGVALLALSASVVRFTTVRGWRRAAVPGLVLVVALSCLSGTNLAFGQYPTVGDLFGGRLAQEVALADVNQPADLVAAPAGQSLSDGWERPDDLPAHGVIASAEIPGTTSGFVARPALIYLPPAYLTVPRAQLPVLVMVTGQPGGPRDWFGGGQLAARMDRFAATHDGLAPVVVVPDILGSTLANPLCLDSRLGNSASYLDRDVPAWIRANLHIDPSPTRWAVGGYSSGGTCALQAGVRSPLVYPSVLDISGQEGPTLGTAEVTAGAAFGGDRAALAAVEPMTQLARGARPAVAAMLVVGDRDGAYRPQQERVADALRRAHVPVELALLNGGHSWAVWGGGVDRGLPWLAHRMGLT
jgi:enterochelin esterase-like enzyme